MARRYPAEWLRRPKLRIRVRGYTARRRKKEGWIALRRGKRVRVTPTKAAWRVGAKVQRRIDIGAPGRGVRVVKKIRKGLMTEKALAYGILKPEQRISDLSEAEMKRLALRLAKDREIGPARAIKMFRVLRVFRKRYPDGFQPRVRAAELALKEKYEEELAPWPAVRAWQRMAPAERRRRMPGGEE